MNTIIDCDVICIGNQTIDEFMVLNEPLVEDSKYVTDKVTLCLGGCGYNVYKTLSSLSNIKTEFCSVLSTSVQEDFNDSPLSLFVDNATPKSVILCRGTNRTIIHSPSMGSNEELDEALLTHLQQTVISVNCKLIFSDSRFPLSTLYLRSICEDLPLLFIDVERNRKMTDELIDVANYVNFSEKGFMSCYGVSSLKSVAFQKCRELITVTHGENGVEFSSRGSLGELPVTNVVEIPIDGTGSGDTFVATLIAEVVTNPTKDHEAMIENAQYAAGENLKSFGGSNIDLSELFTDKEETDN